VRKAKDDAGAPLFNAGDIPSLRNDIRDSDLQKLMIAVIGVEDDEPADMKSSAEAAE